MVSRDGATYAKPLSMQLPDVYSAGTDNATGIDCRGFRRALIILHAGALPSSACTLDVTVQSATTQGGSYSAITGAAFTQVTIANDNAIYIGSIDLTQTQRWLRTSAVVAGSQAEFSVSVILYEHQDSNYQSVTYSFAV